MYAIRFCITLLTSYNRNAHPCHARLWDQGRTFVERHDARSAFHDQLLESHLCLAQGTVRSHVTSQAGANSLVARQPLLSWHLFRLWALMDGMDPPENAVWRTPNRLSGSGLAPLIQPLDRVLPLHPARRRAASRSYQHPDIHVCRALA